MPGPSTPRGRARGVNVAAVVLVVVVGLFAAVATIVAVRILDDIRRERTTRYADQVLVDIESTLGRKFDLARSVRGFFEGSEDVADAEFVAFIEVLDVDVRFRAVRQISIVTGDPAIGLAVRHAAPFHGSDEVDAAGTDVVDRLGQDRLASLVRSPTGRIATDVVVLEDPSTVLFVRHLVDESPDDGVVTMLLLEVDPARTVAQIVAGSDFANGLRVVAPDGGVFVSSGQLDPGGLERRPLPVRGLEGWTLELYAPRELSFVERALPVAIAIAGSIATVLAAVVTAVLAASRRRAVSALEQSRRAEARANVLLDQAPIGTVELDGDRIVGTNARFAELFPSSSVEPGTRLDVRVTDPDRPGRPVPLLAVAQRSSAGAVVRAPGAPLPPSMVVPGVDGLPDRRVLVESVLLDDGHRLVFVEDVTEQEAAAQHLVRAQKMEAIGLLAGGVAHDFNNLLSIMRGRVELLLDAPELGADSRAGLQDVVRTADRAAAIVAQLTTLGRRSSAPAEGIADVAHVVEDVASLVRRATDPDLRIEIEPDQRSEPLYATIPEGRLEQVVVNLVINACDAMPGGGTVRVRLHADAEVVSIDVADTGTGMPPEVLQRLFDPFFTTKEHGTGLGLPMAQAIVAEAGGTLDVRTEVGSGTTMIVRLPRAEAPDPTAEERHDVADEAPASGVRVLVVEDEPLLLDVTVRVLRKAGFDVLAAADADEAERVFATDGPVDALVSDVVLPGRSGVELANDLRRRDAGLAIVLVSGYATDAIEADGGLPDGVTLLGKPVDRNRLVRAVTDALG